MRSSAAVKIPMTPKGVEHFLRLAISSLVPIVKIPMTPKGVEHACEAALSDTGDVEVKIPMTPKGVEHRRVCL